MSYYYACVDNFVPLVNINLDFIFFKHRATITLYYTSSSIRKYPRLKLFLCENITNAPNYPVKRPLYF